LAAHAEVDLVSLVHDRDEEEHAADLRDLARSVTVARVSRWLGYGRAVRGLATGRPFTHALLDARAMGAPAKLPASPVAGPCWPTVREWPDSRSNHH
jgi:hypothetical protein